MHIRISVLIVWILNTVAPKDGHKKAIPKPLAISRTITLQKVMLHFIESFNYISNGGCD